jgi:ATP adenylyltransferase
MERLWTPWRRAYVGGERTVDGDLFEALVAENDDEANLILLRGEQCFVIMNLFPYNTGHLMIVPYRKVADPADLSPAEWREMTELLARMTVLLRQVLRPDGFNIGMNVGAAAGAGIPDHLHLHIVPRWVGDTNFMPVLSATKVLPELLPETYARLRQALGLAEQPASAAAAAPGQPAAPAAAAGPATDTGAPATVTQPPEAPEPPAAPGQPAQPAAESPAAEAAAAPPAGVAPGPPAAEAAPAPGPAVPQAGAVVLLRDKVVLRQARDGTWVLPKGHIEPGETPEQAAAREVAEEMGLSGRLGPFVDELCFTQGGRARRVRYYLLLADRRLPTWDEHFGRDTFLFNPREAQARLTHADARAVLARALELARAR